MSEFPTGIQNNASFQRNFNMRKFERNLLVKRQKCNHLFSIHTVFLVLLAACGIGHSQNFGPNSGNGLDFWQSERPKDMANIVDLEVMCGKRHMEVSVQFDRPFNGIIFSKGAVDRYNCMYVKPQTSQSTYKFDIMYDQCGSKPDLNGQFYENNIVIQYDKDLIEVWDEAKRLRCEWYNDYEKGVTKPPIRVSDLDVVELNFRGDNVDCWMEIQHGKGPWASPVTGIVPLGTTLTMVVGIDDKEGEFDMRLKSCEASDNQNRPIQLSDKDGCVLRPKMFSKFMKMRSTDPRATVVTYSFFHAFKFPDSMAVHIRCKVEICRYGCPDHCQSSAAYVQREQVLYYNAKNDQAAAPSNYQVAPPSPPQPSYTQQNIRVFPPTYQTDPRTPNSPSGGIQASQLPIPSGLRNEKPRIAKKSGDIDMNEEDVGTAKTADLGIGSFLSGLKLPSLPSLPSIFGGSKKEPTIRAPQPKKDTEAEILFNLGKKPKVKKTSQSSSVPVHHSQNQGQPLVFPNSFNTASTHVRPIEPLYATSYDGLAIPYGPRALNVGGDVTPAQQKRKRAAEILSRTERSADIGVHSGYDVVSEFDLDFTPDEGEHKVATLKGKIREETIYGICLPASGFSALFVLLALMTVVSVIVSGFICYHRQLAKVAEEAAPEHATARVATLSHGIPSPTLNQVESSFILNQWNGFNAWFREQHIQPQPIYARQ